MYGLVNKAIEHLALQVGGEAVWQEIKSEAGVNTLAFASMESYPDEVTYALVGAASRMLGMPTEEMLRVFGKHWMLYTAQEGYGCLLNSAGSTIGEFLANLDSLHARVGSLMMPNLVPPSFRVEILGEDVYLVRYYSARTGLAPMVVGLLEGVGARFGHEVRVSHVLRREDVGYDEFRVDIVGVLGAVVEQAEAVSSLGLVDVPSVNKPLLQSVPNVGWAPARAQASARPGEHDR